MNIVEKIPEKATLLDYTLIVYSFFSLYIISYGSVPYAKAFLPIVAIIFVYELIDKKATFNLTDIWLSAAILVTNIIPNFSINRFSDAFVIIVILLKFKTIKIFNKIFINVVYVLGLLSITYHLFFDRFIYDKNIFVLNNPDPNFSGFLALLFFLFCFKYRFTLGILLCTLCIILLLSRNYLYSLVLFFLLLIVENYFSAIYQYLSKKVSLIKVIALFLAVNTLLLFYSITYVSNVRSPFTLEKQNNESRNDINRLVKVQDASNWYRFNANKEFYELVNKRKDIFLFGTSGIYPKMEDADDKSFFPKRVPPHNSLFQLIYTRGVLFTFFYLCALAILIKRLYYYQNLKYILPIIFFGLFLHAVYQGSFLIYFAIIFSLPENKSFSL